MGKTFLIGQLERFGDCLFATTLAKQIQHDHPESRITWAVLSKYKSILELNPDIDEIWEIIPTSEDYYGSVWNEFETEALKRQADGEFDKIIFSQISPRNWIRYNGTIRGTILSAYEKPITVSVEPVVRLSDTEVENVKNFAEKYNLASFKNVILFECAPSSEQSKVNIEFALKVADEITQREKETCIILTTTQKLNLANPNIIDASELSFRENAELTKYCNLLIGCSSGITWLSTSDWAKKLPMIQLLSADLWIFAGVHYDFQINHLDNSQIVEMIEFNERKTVECVLSVIENGVSETKPKFHQDYQPGYFDLKNNTKGLIGGKENLGEIVKFIKNYVEKNQESGNQISAKYLYLILYTYIYGFFYRNIQATETGLFFYLRKIFKAILWKKSH